MVYTNHTETEIIIVTAWIIKKTPALMIKRWVVYDSLFALTETIVSIFVC